MKRKILWPVISKYIVEYMQLLIKVTRLDGSLNTHKAKHIQFKTLLNESNTKYCVVVIH